MTVLLVGCSVNTGQDAEGLRAPESPLLRFFEHKVGRILYLGFDGNLYTSNQTGEDLIQLTQDGNLDINSPDFEGYTRFAWAPNSDQIALIGKSNDEFVLKTINADGTSLMENYVGTDGDPVFLSWTPNGQYVCFLTNQWSPAGGQVQMHYLDPNDHTKVTSMEGGEAYYWAWEPGNNSQFLAHIARDAQSRIVLVSTQPERETVMKLQPGTFATPAWSPDGQQIMLAIADDTKAGNTLVITDLQGRIEQDLGQTGNSTAFSWAPDGKYVAFIASDRKWGNPLGPLTVQGIESPDKKITVDDPFAFAFFWSPDSEKIAYFTLEMAAGDKLSADNGGFSSLVTLYMLDVKKGEKKNLLSFYPTYPFMEVLQNFDQYQYSSSFWSPDSENLVVSTSAGDGASAAIVVVPVSGNLEPRPIAEGWLAFWSTK